MVLAKKIFFILGFVLFCGILCLLGIATWTFENRQKLNKAQDLFEMSLEELMEVEITSAPKKPELMDETPRIMVVVSPEQLELQPDRNFTRLLQRQPGICTQGSFIYSDNFAGFYDDI